MEPENNNLDLREFGYTDQNLAPTADTRDLTPAFEMPELNIKPISYPSETPVQKMERAKKEMPSIVDRVRQSTNVTFADESMFGKGLGADLVEASKPKGMVLHRNDTSLGEIYDNLSDGTFIPRYENFVSGTNNEERLARQQSAGSKWWGGLTKLVAKTGLYGAGGIINPVYGAIDAIKTGNFNAVWDNDFMDFMNDQDTRLNYSLPNYYTQEEKNRSFLGKMGTANFWANDVLGGMAFTTGALVSEGFWSFLTGGASLAGSAARMGARAAGRKAVMGTSERMGKKYFANLKTTLNSYLRSSSRNASIAGAINNGRFIMTSAGWEASVEASHYMKEAELNFVNSFKESYGRNPLPGELDEFRRTATSAGNAVFAANIGVVGLSNILQFGQYFGTGFDLASKVDRGINRTFGLGARFNKAGMLERVSASKFRKGLGVTYNLAKRPFTEGVWEEGTQGVVSEAAAAWIKSRYDKDAARKNMDIIDALSEGFAQTYGTPEGRMEIGIGAIIGALTGVAGGKSTGFGGITEYAQQSRAVDARIEAYNKNNVPEAAINLATRLAYANQQVASMDEAEGYKSKRDHYATRQAYDKALFSKFMAEDDFGLLDDSARNFAHVIENMDVNEMVEEYGISREEAEQMKRDILNDYNTQLEDFRTATRFASSIMEGSPRRGENGFPMKDYVAMNIFLGIRADENMKRIAGELAEVMGDPKIKDAIYFYSTLSKEGMKLEEEKSDLDGLVEQLEKEIQDINTRIEEEGAREEYIKKAQRLLQVRDRLNQINEELSHYRGALWVNDLTAASQNFSVESAYDQMRKLDGYINALRKSGDQSDKHRADLLDALAGDLARSYADYNQVNELLGRLRDPRFMADEAKRLAKMFDSGGVTYDEENLPDGFIWNKELEDKINKDVADGKISPEEGFTLRTFNRMKTAYIGDQASTDPISDEEWRTYTEVGFAGMHPNTRAELADKVFEEDKLSAREKSIYEANRDVIDKMNAGRGENIRTRLNRVLEKIKKKKNRNFDTTKEANEAVINDALDAASEEERERMKAIIDARNILRNAIDDGREEVDMDLLAQHERGINDFGDAHGVDNLLDFVEQNRIIDRGLEKFTPTGSVTDVEDLVDHAMPPETSRGGASFDNAQNIEMLTSKKDKNGNNYIISGMNSKRFGDMLISKMGGVEIENTNDDKARIIRVGDVEIRLYPAVHSAVKISVKDVMALEAISLERGFGPVFTLQPAIAGANSREVLWLQDGRLNIIPTNVSYGKKGADIISDRDVLSVKKDDRVIARVDFADDYNRQLYKRVTKSRDEFHAAEKVYNESDKSNDGLRVAMEQKREAYEKARTFARDNLVIKIIDNESGEGKFVSVLKGMFQGQTITGNQVDLLNTREKAFGLFMANAESRKDGHMDVGTFSVKNTLPGRPNLNMRIEEDGRMVVEDRPITELDAEHIVTIGYMLNGRIVVKDKADFQSYPFMSLVSRNSRHPGDKYYNMKMPFVVIKHPNGISYAYPVKASDAINADKDTLIRDLDFLKDKENEGFIDRDQIISLNTYALRSGVNPQSFIRLAGSFDDIRSDMAKMREALEGVSQSMDVSQWITSSKSAKEIAVESAMINISLSEGAFHAPKLVIDLSDGTKGEDAGSEDAPMIEGNDEGDSSTDETDKLLNAPC